MRPAVVMAFLATLMIGTGPAGAEDDTEARARRLFKRANSKVDRGDLAGAADDYRAAYRLVPRPKLLINLAVVLEARGDKARLANVWQEYIEHPTRDRDLAQQLAGKLDAIDRDLGRIRIIAGPGGVVEVDGREIAKGPVVKVWRVEPGPHRVVARFDAGEIERQVTPAAGEEETVELEAPPEKRSDPDPDPVLPPDPAPPATGMPFYQRYWIYPATASLLAAGAGIYFGLQAQGDEDAYQSLLERPNPEFSDAKHLKDRGERRALIANVSFISAGALLVTSGVLLYFDVIADDGTESAPPVGIAPAPGGAMVFRGWEF